ncbi:MAG TPA: alpha/beta fold hydrolase [Anaerolineae bacterium]|jgi:pimeloyl-ACP methyl ester carboxylesterase|nr:alpha/beta fold hydrolase [Anaerolineae bacterium]
MTRQEQQNAFRLWNLIAGLVIGLTAVLSLPLIYGDLGGDRGFVNWFTIFIGAFFSGIFFWWLLIGRTRDASVLRGVIAGALSAILAYPIVFLLNELILREVSAAVGLTTLPNRILHALTAAGLALLFGGWFTVLAGALIGGLLALVQKRVLPTIGDDMADLVDAGTDRVSDFAHRRPVQAVIIGLILVLIVFILAAGSWVWFAPLATGGLHSEPEPVADYDAAVAATEARQEQEALLNVNPACQTSLISHGQRTEKAIVYVHGFTNCPAQFDQLGQEFFDLGYNVFVPRMPHHGLSDRLTDDLSHLTAEELTAFADETMDIARGLGEEVTVVGLSGGGSVAGWIAQERQDVDNVVIIAPMFGILSLPPFSVKPLANAALTLPNLFMWWDPATKEAIPGPDYAYPRYATEAAGNLLRLGRYVNEQAAEKPPAAGRIVAVTNAVDPAVNNEVFAEIVDRWRSAGFPVESYEFPAELNLPHDVVDPRQPDARTELVYPILIDLITGS